MRNNAATIFVTQIPWDQRKGVTTPKLVGDFFMKTGHIKEGLALAFAPPRDLRARQLPAARSSTSATAAKAAPQALARRWAACSARLQQDPMFVQVNSLWKPNVPQLFVDVDREKAKALGVSVDEIFNTLSATLGSYYVNDFNKYGRTWQVLMSAEPTLSESSGRYRRSVGALGPQ